MVSICNFNSTPRDAPNFNATQAQSGKQQGDPKKGARVIINVVKGEGAAKDKPFVPVVLLGSDCYQVVKNVLEKDIEKIEDWKKITCSTDYD